MTMFGIIIAESMIQSKVKVKYAFTAHAKKRSVLL